jgi:lysophospholipase L1-like esterase
MASANGKKEQPAPETNSGVKRRGLLRFGTLVTAFSGVAAISALGANGANAASGDKNPPTAYVPTAEKGVASGVATLNIDAKIPSAQLPDLSVTIRDQIETAATAPAGVLATTFGTITQKAMAKLYAGLAARQTRPAQVIFAGSSTMFGGNSSVPALSVAGLLLTMCQNAFPSGLPDETSLLRIETAAAQTRPGVHGINAAIGGRTSANYLDSRSIAQIAALGNIAAIFHMVGSNDYAGSVPPETYRTNLTSQIAALDAAVPGQIVHILIHQQPRDDTPGGRPYAWEEFGQVLKEVAAAAPDKRAFFDVNRMYAEAGWPGADPLNLVDTDNVHQTDAGHAFLADLLRRQMEIPAGQRETFIIADTFSRPDNASLGIAETGQAWAPLAAAAPAVIGNKAKLTTGGTVLIESSRADVDLSAIVTLGTGAAQGIVFRALDADNRLSLMFESSNFISLYKHDTAAASVVAQAAATFTAGTTHTLRVHVKGDLVTAYLDGVKKFAYTLTAPEQTKYGAYTKVGFRDGTSDDGFRLDSYGVKIPR